MLHVGEIQFIKSAFLKHICSFQMAKIRQRRHRTRQRMDSQTKIIDLGGLLVSIKKTTHEPDLDTSRHKGAWLREWWLSRLLPWRFRAESYLSHLVARGVDRSAEIAGMPDVWRNHSSPPRTPTYHAISARKQTQWWGALCFTAEKKERQERLNISNTKPTLAHKHEQKSNGQGENTYRHKTT